MRIDTFYDGVELHRREKIIFARFLIPHQVLSTCLAAGGLRDDLTHLYNHQSCEPAGHMHALPMSVYRNPEHYRSLICERHGLPAPECATLGTAANMNNAAIVSERFRDLEVIAVCTGGVEGNAGRAGDPAAILETPDGYERLTPEREEPGPGTINTMIFINWPLTPGAMTRVIMMATEAKTAALQELAVNSRYSDGLATGTGTDQIAVAAARRDLKPLAGAGKHSKLGELIGVTVLNAVKQTLALQNNLTPSGQCSAKIHLERFGLNRETMRENVCRHLDAESAALFGRCMEVVERDPVTVAAVAAIAHLRDKFTWGILPLSCWPEIMGGYAAQIACAVSGKNNRMEVFRQQLEPTRTEIGNGAFVDLVCRAIGLGFAEKWPRYDVDEVENKEGKEVTGEQ